MGLGNASGYDLWGNLDAAVADGWFVPSDYDWEEIIKAFDITRLGYSSFNLAWAYWTSSGNQNWGARIADLSYEVYTTGADGRYLVRLVGIF